MFNLVHVFDDGTLKGRSVLCTDGKFHNAVMLNRPFGGITYRAKQYKTLAGANRAAATWNSAVSDYCSAVAA